MLHARMELFLLWVYHTNFNPYRYIDLTQVCIQWRQQTTARPSSTVRNRVGHLWRYFHSICWQAPWWCRSVVVHHISYRASLPYSRFLWPYLNSDASFPIAWSSIYAFSCVSFITAWILFCSTKHSQTVNELFLAGFLCLLLLNLLPCTRHMSIKCVHFDDRLVQRIHTPSKVRHTKFVTRRMVHKEEIRCTCFCYFPQWTCRSERIV